MYIKNILRKTLAYAEKNGLKDTIYRSAQGLYEAYEDERYRRSFCKDNLYGSPKSPIEKAFKISIVVPAFDPEEDHFDRLLESVEKQTYRNAELIIADAGPRKKAKAVLDTFAAQKEDISDCSDNDIRFRYIDLPENRGISENTNRAIFEAEGDFIAFLDHDDFLEPGALEEVVRALQGGAEIAYTDEDKYDGRQEKFFRANIKPDFNLSLLLSNNYICHLLVMKRSLVQDLGGLRRDYDGAQDYDLLLRAVLNISRRSPNGIVGPEKIIHVPKVLYHWRATEASTSDNAESKPYAYEAGAKAIEDYFKARGIACHAGDTHPAHKGFYRTDLTENSVPMETVKFFMDKRLIPETLDYARIMRSYFIRHEIGAVGGRIVGQAGRVISSGFKSGPGGVKIPLMKDLPRQFSGPMHRAAMLQDVEAVSVHACAVRSELMDCYSNDCIEMFRKIRERGYLVLIDPEMVFRLEKYE